mgnify:CR=1 FL=1
MGCYRFQLTLRTMMAVIAVLAVVLWLRDLWPLWVILIGPLMGIRIERRRGGDGIAGGTLGGGIGCTVLAIVVCIYACLIFADTRDRLGYLSGIPLTGVCGLMLGWLVGTLARALVPGKARGRAVSDTKGWDVFGGN